jgi:hypothetical protein
VARNFTLTFARANAYALALVIPILIFYLVPYGGIYGWKSMVSDLLLFFTNIPLLLGSFIVGTAFHELIHAISWSLFDGIPWKKVHFGFKWSTFTPYVHCPEPVEVTNYRWGVAMPGIVLGLLPYLFALILQNGWLLGFGLFFTLAASGDLLILWLLKNVPSGTLVQDHPDLVGCRVFGE